MGTFIDILYIHWIFVVWMIVKNPCYGSMQLTVQLNNYTNPKYTLAYNNTSCASQAFGRLAITCNFQFTTVISLANSSNPTTISTHLIPLDNTSMINFNNTVPITNCPTQPAPNFKCNDSTWQDPKVLLYNQRPTSIHILVSHYGSIAYQNSLVPESFVPPTSWYVDTHYLDLTRIQPSSSADATPQNVSLMLSGTQNNGMLGITITMQCLGNWLGPDCSFSSCQNLTNNYAQCRMANDGTSYRWLCPLDNSGQPTNCQFCPNGISGNDCSSSSSGSGSGPTNFNQTGWTAGIVVLAIVVLIELIIIIAGCVYISKKKKENQPSSSSASNSRGGNTQSNYKTTSGNKSKDKGNYRPAPIAEPESEWPNENRFPSDEYSTPNRNGNRQEAAV